MLSARNHSELNLFRRSVRRFLADEVVPHAEAGRANGYIDRELWRKAGALGLLCVSTPDEFGGGGGNFWHEAVLIEELARIAFPDFSIPLQNVILAPYFVQYATEEQKQRWLPRMASGDLVAALAMSEPARAPTSGRSAPTRAATATTTSSTARKHSSLMVIPPT